MTIERSPIATGGVRLARTLGTTSFCPGPGMIVLGWSADGSVIYLTRRAAQGVRLWRMDAQNGALLSVRQLASRSVAVAAPAGTARAVVQSLSGISARFALWDLDARTLLGEISLAEAPATTVVLEQSQLAGSSMHAREVYLRRLADEAPRDGADPGAVSLDGSLFLRRAPVGPSHGVGVFDATGACLGILEATKEETIELAAFTADGGVLVAFVSGALGCWDLDRRAWRWRAPRHRDWVVTLVRATDDRTFYSYGVDGFLRATTADGRSRWETPLRRLGFVVDHQNYPLAGVVPSPDGRLVAVGLGDSLRVIDAETGADRTVLDGHAGAVTCLTFSRDGRLLASGATDGDVRIYEVSTGETRWVLEADGAAIGGVAFRPDRASVLVLDRDSVGSEWSLDTGLELSRVTEDERLGDLTASADGDRVLFTYGTRRRLWLDRSPGRTQWDYEHPYQEEDDEGAPLWVYRGGSVDGFSGDGARVLLTWQASDRTYNIRTRWVTLDVERGRPLGSPRTVPGAVRAVVQGDEQTCLLVATPEGFVVLDEEGRERPGRVLTSSAPSLATLSRDHRVLAFVADKGLKVWRLGSPSRRLGTVALPPHEDVTVLAFSPDARTLAVGTTRGRVWLFAVDGDPTP